MVGKKTTMAKDKSHMPSTSAGEEEVDVKPDLSDILRCGACELIFFNLDDFVAHKSEDCQASKATKSSSDDSDVEVIRHSPSKVKKYKSSKKSSYEDYKRDYHSNSSHRKNKYSDYYMSKKEKKHRYKENKYIQDIKIKEEPLDEEEETSTHCGICENCIRTEDCDECEVCLPKTGTLA